MADGAMRRWEPGLDRPKHLLTIEGETLLARLVRQLRSIDPEASVIITSHDPRYELPGAVRYEPQNNRLELDRFTWELIEDGVCFLYGDTYYSDESLRRICQAETNGLRFVGNRNSIVALKVGSGDTMKDILQKLRFAYEDGHISECKGWQVFEFYTGLSQCEAAQSSRFIMLTDETRDFNEWHEYCRFLEERESCSPL